MRSVNPSSDWLSTVAGTGSFGPAGNGGRATRTDLSVFDPIGTTGADATALDQHGNLLVADGGEHRIQVVARSTGTFYGQAMTAGRIYAVAGNGTFGYSGDGGPATSAELRSPNGIAVDGAGNLVIADTDHRAIRVVAASTGTFYGQAMTAGDIYRVAGNGREGRSGDGRLATRAELNRPQGVATDGSGNVLIADTVNGRIQLVAATSGTFYGQAMTAGDIYTIAGDSAPPNGMAATAAQLDQPNGVAADSAGNLLIADSGYGRVRVVAHASGTFYGRPMTAGDVYTVAGGGTQDPGSGGPATAAELHPTAVAADGSGNLVIAENASGDLSLNRIMVLAEHTGTFYGQAMTAGNIYTVAGGGADFTRNGIPGTEAELDRPNDVAVDGAGNLVITDSGSSKIRVLAGSTGTFYTQPMTAGDIYTIAGTGANGFNGNGGPAVKARISSPEGVAIDAAGNVLIADTGNSRIRVVAESTGTFYGQPMTAGDIYKIAGTGRAGSPVTAARPPRPRSIVRWP